jgi:CHAD domain-containing protein
MAKPKPIEGLDCGASAREGVRLVLASRFAEMLSYREAALDFSQIEGVHDMRVASRRLRSAVRAFAPHVRRAKPLERVRGELRRLARTLGAVRDEDVAINALGELMESAPEAARAGVERLLAEHEARRSTARVALTEALEDERVEDLRLRFDEAVTTATASSKRKRRAKKDTEGSFAEAGRAIVGRSWEELRDLSTSLYRPHRQRRLHRMRIAAKRLRYALELFSACAGGSSGEAKKLASEISDLQDALGHLHDCDEWIEEIGEHLSGKIGDAQSEGGRQERAGLVWLLDHFAAERAENYRKALRLWHEWESGHFERRIAACFEQSASDEVEADGEHVRPESEQAGADGMEAR